jgi:hypothetical protein
MKDPFKKIEKEKIYEVKVNLPIYDKVLEAIDKIDLDRLLPRRPLDTSVSPVFTYGDTYWRHQNYMDVLINLIKNDHTLKARQIMSDRRLYTYATFFVAPDNCYEDPRTVIRMLLAQFEILANLAQEIDCRQHKTVTTKHNLKLLQDYILADALTFLESILREPNDLPVH